MIQDLKSTNVVREFGRIRESFESIRGEETALTPAFQCLEQQIALFVKQGIIHSDDEVLESLATAGLQLYDLVSGNSPRNWGDLPESVQQLAGNLTQSFDPASNPELQRAANLAWTKPEESRAHFQVWGSVVRRLMDSVRARQKRDPRAYCRFVVTFVAAWSKDDKVHWVLLSQNVDQLSLSDLT